GGAVERRERMVHECFHGAGNGLAGGGLLTGVAEDELRPAGKRGGGGRPGDAGRGGVDVGVNGVTVVAGFLIQIAAVVAHGLKGEVQVLGGVGAVVEAFRRDAAGRLKVEVGLGKVVPARDEGVVDEAVGEGVFVVAGDAPEEAVAQVAHVVVVLDELGFGGAPIVFVEGGDDVV